MVAMLVTVTPASAMGSGSWTTTGTMTSPRASATATLLRKRQGAGHRGVQRPGDQHGLGRALRSGHWDLGATGSMTAARSAQTATLLASGKVLVAGPDATASLYEPVTGTWATTGPMASAPGSGAAATLLPGGTVLVAGECCAQSPGLPTALASAQIYDPVSNTWAATASMSTGRGNATTDRTWLPG